MEKERNRQPTLLLPQGLSGLLVFTSRINIKMGEVCLSVYVCDFSVFMCFAVREEKKGSECVRVHECNW